MFKASYTEFIKIKFMNNSKENSSKNVGFDACTFSVKKSLYDFDQGIMPGLKRISNIIAKSSLMNDFKQFLPKIQNIHSRLGDGDDSNNPVFAEHGLLQRNIIAAGISVDFHGHGTILPNGLFYANEQPLDVIVENSELNILVSVYNGTPSSIKGFLIASFIDSAGNTIPISKLKISELPTYSLSQVSLIALVPKADINVILRIELVNEKNEMVTQTDSIFDIAALFVLTINSAHVFEARSPRNDSLIFGIGVEPHRNRDNLISIGPQVFLGDHGDGDTIPIDQSFTIALFPKPDSIYTFPYFLVNDGDVRSPRDAADLAAKISLVFDLFSGGITTDGNDGKFANDVNPVFGRPHMSASVSYDIWYQIVYAVLSFNCNGIVAYDQVFCNGMLLIPAILNGNPLIQTITYKGSDSPVGCGANSKYSITRTIERIS